MDKINGEIKLDINEKNIDDIINDIVTLDRGGIERRIEVGIEEAIEYLIEDIIKDIVKGSIRYADKTTVLNMSSLQKRNLIKEIIQEKVVKTSIDKIREWSKERMEEWLKEVGKMWEKREII